MKLNFSHLNVGHDQFEIDNVIAASGVTEFGIYTQCLREIRTRLDALTEADLNIPRPAPSTIAHVWEISRFYSIAVTLAPKFEKLTRDQYQKLATERSKESIRLQILTQVTLFGSISPDLAQVICSLPRDIRESFITLAQNSGQCAEELAQFVIPVDFSKIPTISWNQIDDPSLEAARRILRATSQPLLFGLQDHT